MSIEHGIDPSEALALVGEVGELQRRTRLFRQGFWFPLVLMGLVILVATPLYFQPSQAASLGLPAGVVFRARPASTPLPRAHAGQADAGIHGHLLAVPRCTAVHGVVYTPCYSSATSASVSEASLLLGGEFTASPRAISLYWLVALPLAYLLVGWWYLARARRRGVSTSPVAYVVTGIVLLVLFVLSSPWAVGHLHLPAGLVPGDLSGRGLMPLLTIGLGLLVLGYQERSRALAGFAVAFLALALLVNLYDLENLAYRIGLHVGPETGVFVAGVFMLAGGAAFGLLGARRHAL